MRCRYHRTQSEALALTGVLVVEIRSARTGRLLRRLRESNLVVNAGLTLVRDLLDSTIAAPTPPTHLAFGTDATAAAGTQTALVAEVFRDALTSRVRTGLTITFKHFLSSSQANGNTLREWGLFNAAAAGTMFSRAVFGSPIIKTTSITVTSQWTVTVGV